MDNALDACEEAGILPNIFVHVHQREETRFSITVRDNGPGIIREQIDKIFGKLLYGSKFHRLKMSRGQHGIGIAAAGMYGVMTTGKPMLVISRTRPSQPVHHVWLKIDTLKNRPRVVKDDIRSAESNLFPDGHGTQVLIELEGRYQKGRQSIDEYLEQTAIVNPHAQITYITPSDEIIKFARSVDQLPDEPLEINPHPKGIEFGTLLQMLDRTKQKHLGDFLRADFCRIGPGKAKEICEWCDLTVRTWVKRIDYHDAELLYWAMQRVKLKAPPAKCLVPIGAHALLSGLLKNIKAEFYTSALRPAYVYRGNPFQVEAAVAFGGELPAREQARLLRFVNRVPLLYQQSACAAHKAVVDTNWKIYGLSQTRGNLPTGPLVILLHMSSVWAPFTSEAKDAIAHYEEIHKEMKLAMQECGRKLGRYLHRRNQMKYEAARRHAFQRYIGEIAKSCEALTEIDAKVVYNELLKQARNRTAVADKLGMEVDEVGKHDQIDRDDGMIIDERPANREDSV